VSLPEALDLGLAALVLAVAVWTIATKEAFAAVVGFVAYGLLLTIVWVRLHAVDVAITEAAIGSGVTGVLLVGGVTRMRQIEVPAAPEQPGLAVRLAAGVLASVIAIALAAVVLLLQQLEPAPSLAGLVAKNLPSTGVDNPITGVLMAFRSFDTLLEKVVLVLAVVGVWSLTPDRFWGGAPGAPRASSPNGALTFLAQVLAPLGVVIGIHIVWVGASEPGGAFQGGAILAAMWMIAMIARLAEAPPISALWLRLALVAGPALFIAIGVAGFVIAGDFLAYPVTFAKPLILVIEAFMTLTIALTLPMLVAGPPDRARDPGASR
jgi:multisubunit Na+/H+ antiporter MnhB subunit